MKEKNALYEKEIINLPNPNGWFTMTLIFNCRTTNAYINNAEKLSLIIVIKRKSKWKNPHFCWR